MKQSPLSRLAIAAALLIGAAVPAVAQSVDTQRPHHANYGNDAQYRSSSAQAPTLSQAGSHGAYRRPHHAD